MTSLSEVILTQ